MHLYKETDYHVCRLMTQDSMPPFVKTEKYKDLIAHKRIQEQQRIENASADATSFLEEDYASDNDDDELSRLAEDLHNLELHSVASHVVGKS